MAVFVKIACGNCGGSFELHQARINKRDYPAICPHCFTEMDAGQWEELINAFYVLHDWNYQNRKAHAEHNTARFTVQLSYLDVPTEKILFD